VDIANNEKLRLLKELYSKKELSNCCNAGTEFVKIVAASYLRCTECNRPCLEKDK
jgi:hypothetical protein